MYLKSISTTICVALSILCTADVVAGNAGTKSTVLDVEGNLHRTSLVYSSDMVKDVVPESGILEARIRKPKNSSEEKRTPNVISIFRGCDRCEYMPLFTDYRAR